MSTPLNPVSESLGTVPKLSERLTKIGDPDYDLPLLMGEEIRKDNQVQSLGKADLRLSFASQFGYLDLVQEVCDTISRMVGFDEDTRYWICLSIRESVSNAIQHGNKMDENKKVGIQFESFPDRLVILVQDEGEGFDESQVRDPLDPKNLLKPGGRGVFFVRSFMDEVGFEPLPGGGLQMRMEKRLNHKKQGEEENDN